MCFEWKNRFTCGHIGFNQVERCAQLGTGCFGPDGTERFVAVDGLCYDCRARLKGPALQAGRGAVVVEAFRREKGNPIRPGPSRGSNASLGSGSESGSGSGLGLGGK
ncbi:hypothetical protein C8A00DRAFT_15682 [Chaetomidium leptoderma]|uniref:Uncharacterized protein n=1 Tax=Chaetomidium leptoderma TaxID=669021 RepID=A0AAN6VMK9_9PEZI|nr:hypothetical protein C8A00DRAFT_15682 [Chaetomidium leptoderma]